MRDNYRRQYSQVSSLFRYLHATMVVNEKMGKRERIRVLKGFAFPELKKIVLNEQHAHDDGQITFCIYQRYTLLAAVELAGGFDLTTTLDTVSIHLS